MPCPPQPQVGSPSHWNTPESQPRRPPTRMTRCLCTAKSSKKVCHTVPTQDFTPPPEGCGHELWRLGRAHSLSQLLPSHRNTPESQPRRPPTQSPHTASCCLAIGMGTPLRASRGARRIEFSHKPKAARVFRKPLHPSRESSRGLWRCDCSV